MSVVGLWLGRTVTGNWLGANALTAETQENYSGRIFARGMSRREAIERDDREIFDMLLLMLEAEDHGIFA